MTAHDAEKVKRRLAGEARGFLRDKDDERLRAATMAALFLAGGIDMDRVLNGSDEACRNTLAKLDRLIERERLKGRARHWSYDLNRHIALKQARDVIAARIGATMTNGARRRRLARFKKA
ncbi:cytoplasmic protein [Nitratireductor mangrovi]|uniref:cytoplasmic protein n=1 Tax=Nitratireductor mangrovi TaxID=2599600 RepID=UPI003D7B6916